MKIKRKQIVVGIMVACIIIVGLGMNYIGKVSLCAKSDGVMKDGICMGLDYLGICALKQDIGFMPVIYDPETMIVINESNDDSILNS